MTKICFLLGAAFLLSGTALAGGDLGAAIAARLGNTIIATDADGTATHMYWQADHAVEVWRTGPKGSWKGSAKWAVEGGQLCLSYTPPRPGIGAHECMKPGVIRRLGDHWQGAGRTITMVKGRK